MIIALLNHELNQHYSTKRFCELPPSVNDEFGDFLSLALSLKLGIQMPDRLDDMLTGDVVSLCRNAWDEFDRPIKPWLVKQLPIFCTFSIGFSSKN